MSYPQTQTQTHHEDQRSHISVSQKDRIRLIPVHDIYYLKAENKYIVIQTLSEQYLISGTLKKLSADLAGRFLRVHRNTLVATHYISGLEKNDRGCWCVVLNDIDDRLEVSRRHTPKVRRWLKYGVVD